MSQKFNFGIVWLDNISDPFDRLIAKKAYEASLSFRVDAGMAETTQLRKMIMCEARKNYPLCPADYDELGDV